MQSFLQGVSIAACYLSYRKDVGLSHPAILSKRRKLWSRNFHRQLCERLYYTRIRKAFLKIPKGCTPTDSGKQERGREHLQFLTNNLPYLRNGAR